MPAQYKYRAVTGDGRFRDGVITAQNLDQVEEFLQTQRLIPIKVRRVGDRRPFTLFGFLKGADYEAWALALENEGFAETDHFAKEIIELVQGYRLDAADR